MYPAHQSFESGCDNKAPIAIPYVMLKLEKELQTPKNLPNKSKYLGKDKEKWLTKLVSESFEGQKLQQSLQQYIREFKQKLDECRCWSPYLNGFQLTIADLIILHMVFQLLSKVCLSWIFNLRCTYIYIVGFNFYILNILNVNMPNYGSRRLNVDIIMIILITTYSLLHLLGAFFLLELLISINLFPSYSIFFNSAHTVEDLLNLAITYFFFKFLR